MQQGIALQFCIALHVVLHVARHCWGYFLNDVNISRNIFVSVVSCVISVACSFYLQYIFIHYVFCFGENLMYEPSQQRWQSNSELKEQTQTLSINLRPRFGCFPPKLKSCSKIMKSHLKIFSRILEKNLSQAQSIPANVAQTQEKMSFVLAWIPWFTDNVSPKSFF